MYPPARGRSRPTGGGREENHGRASAGCLVRGGHRRTGYRSPRFFSYLSPDSIKIVSPTLLLPYALLRAKKSDENSISTAPVLLVCCPVSSSNARSRCR